MLLCEPVASEGDGKPVRKRPFAGQLSAGSVLYKF
jgi:hypothetical protein